MIQEGFGAPQIVCQYVGYYGLSVPSVPPRRNVGIRQCVAFIDPEAQERMPHVDRGQGNAVRPEDADVFSIRKSH